ncbi:MAG TPA: TlpA disulfide reductase family protein [Chitinophagales bacterium]|nr:TlpA disulfide reductase family protein [Chitinophagales bacterium]
MRFLTAIVPLFLVTFCQSVSTPETKPAAPAATASPAPVYQMKPDTIEIRGKFLAGCTMPGTVKIALHNVDNTFWKDVSVTSGEFKFKHFLTEPRRIAIRTIYGVKFDFFATTDEKVYNVEIDCSTKTEVFDIKGSAENAAYRPFALAQKKFQDTLDSLGKSDISNPDAFNLVKQTISDYQKTIAEIASAHPATFTAKVFCAAERLPEGALNSLESLRKNFLLREAYANPHFYNDFTPHRILLNYLAIRDKKADPGEPIETLMTIALKNPEAAKRWQEPMGNIFFNMHQEDLVKAYIDWAERNPDKMYNQSMKGKLKNMKRVVSGNPFIDFELKDPRGQPRKLSETVNAGKLTVLIFYSPTCGHCKEKVPELLPVWERYKGKGLKIYAVGSNAKNEEWSAFITRHANPEWVHVFQYDDGLNASDLYYASNPTFILIDGKGTILSRIWDLEHVIEEIKKMLG